MPEIETASELAMVLSLVALWSALLATALYDLVRRERVLGGNKLLWGVVVVLFSIVGPLTYLMAGRQSSRGRAVRE